MAKLFGIRRQLDELPTPVPIKSNINQGNPYTPPKSQAKVVSIPDNLKGTTNTLRYVDEVSMADRLQQYKLGSTNGLPQYIFSDINTGYISLKNPKTINKTSTVTLRKIDASESVLRQGGILTLFEGIVSIVKPNKGFAFKSFIIDPGIKIVEIKADSLITDPNTKINKITPGDRIIDPDIRIIPVSANSQITIPNTPINFLIPNDLIVDPNITIQPIVAGSLITDPNTIILPVVPGSMITDPNTQIIPVVPGSMITDPNTPIVPVVPGSMITDPNTPIIPIVPGSMITDPNTPIVPVVPGSMITDPNTPIVPIVPGSMITDPNTPITPVDPNDQIVDPNTPIKPVVPGSRIIDPGVIIRPVIANQLIIDPNIIIGEYDLFSEDKPDFVAASVESGTPTGNPEFDARGENEYTPDNDYGKKTPDTSKLFRRGTDMEYIVLGPTITWPPAQSGVDGTPGAYKTLNYGQIQKRVNDPNEAKKDYVVALGLNKKPEIDNYEQRLGMPADGPDTINKDLQSSANDLVKLKITSVRDDVTLQFRAYLTSFNDNYSPSYTDVNYIGRPDTLKIYKGVVRTMNLGFKIPLVSEEELPVVYRKLEKLVQIGVMGKVSTYMLGPFLRLTLGGWLHKTPIILNSLKYDTNPLDYSWDIQKEVPQVIDVSMDCIALSDNAGVALTNQGSYIRAASL